MHKKIRICKFFGCQTEPRGDEEYCARHRRTYHNSIITRIETIEKQIQMLIKRQRSLDVHFKELVNFWRDAGSKPEWLVKGFKGLK